MNYVAYWPSGQIQQTGTCEPALLAAQGAEGTAKMETDTLIPSSGFYVAGSVVLPIQITLQDQKDAKWAQVKQARAAALVAPVLQTRFGAFDADDAAVESVKNTVIGLGEAAKIGMAPAAITWTLADNSAVALTPTELSEVSALLLLRGDAAYTRARTLRLQIDAATTPADLALIFW